MPGECHYFVHLFIVGQYSILWKHCHLCSPYSIGRHLIASGLGLLWIMVLLNIVEHLWWSYALFSLGGNSGSRVSGSWVGVCLAAGNKNRMIWGCGASCDPQDEGFMSSRTFHSIARVFFSELISHHGPPACPEAIEHCTFPSTFFIICCLYAYSLSISSFCDVFCLFSL